MISSVACHMLIYEVTNFNMQSMWKEEKVSWETISDNTLFGEENWLNK